LPVILHNLLADVAKKAAIATPMFARSESSALLVEDRNQTHHILPRGTWELK
jgi:hypothetical protein